MTETGGGAWRQTIFYPFQHMSRYGRGRVLKPQVACETYPASYYDPRGSLDQTFPIPAAPYLKLAAVATGDGGLSLFALNRDLARPMTVTIAARGFEDLAVAAALQLRDDDLAATNSTAAPERIKPVALDGVKSDGGKISLQLAPASWNVIALAPALPNGSKA
jgi:alpha-L-arabinofuranosidase